MESFGARIAFYLNLYEWSPFKARFGVFRADLEFLESESEFLESESEFSESDFDSSESDLNFLEFSKSEKCFYWFSMVSLSLLCSLSQPK